MTTLPPSRWLKFLLPLLLIVCAVNVGRVVQLQTETASAGDFYTYWYYGHFLRTAENPYIAFADGAAVQPPITYRDGRTYTTIPDPGDLHAPTNTAPIILLVGSLALFSWHIARPLWLFVNVVLALWLPSAAMRLLPNHAALQWRDRLWIYALFWASPAVRLTLNQGQTVFLITAFAISSLTAVQRGRPILGGILLGLALSKPSLTFPILIIYLLFQQYRVVLVALAIQFLSFASLALWSNTTLNQTVTAYSEAIRLNVATPGIHFTYWLPYGYPILIIATLFLALFLLKRWFPNRTPTPYHILHLLTIGLLWVLHAGYHNRYDIVIALFFYVLLVGGLRDRIWQLSPRATTMIRCGVSAAVCFLALPVDIVPGLPGQLLRMVGSLTTVGFLLLAVWLYGRFMSSSPGNYSASQHFS